MKAFKTTLTLFSAIALLFITSCKKDYAEAWVGVYNGSASGATNRVVVSRVDNNTVKMELQTLVGGSTYVTYATIANGKVSSNFAVTISETGTVAGNSGKYTFLGGGTLTGNLLALSGSATQPGATTLYYSFTGTR